MKADIDGAVRIARIASGFDWTWTEQDVSRFCQAAQWNILHEDRGYGPTLRTNLEVHLPQCQAYLSWRWMDRQNGSAGAIDRLVVYVADSGQSTSAKPLSDALHHQLRDRLIEELGPVSEYVFGEDLETDYWRGPDVVISLAAHDTFIHMDLVSPRYQRSLDDDGAHDFSDDDEDG